MLTGLWFVGQKYASPVDSREADVNPRSGIFERVGEWLDIYYGGDEPGFVPPLSLDGSEFRRAVWRLLMEIPRGETMAYGELSRLMARKRKLASMSAQAVGGAVAHNPVSIIVPCHRVVGADGALTGYAGGLERKKYLLKLEGARTD